MTEGRWKAGRDFTVVVCSRKKIKDVFSRDTLGVSAFLAGLGEGFFFLKKCG